ncbi:MAG: heme-binding protein [Sphingomicrobium sp.]
MEQKVGRTLAAGAALAGVALAGAAYYVFQEKQTEEPEFRALRSDDAFQIRDYPEVVVAETIVDGPRKDALGRGFSILAGYIFAKSRDGEKLAMTVPVMQDSGDPMGSDPPMFDDDLMDGGWRTRFVMPAGRKAGDLPTPPAGVALVTMPPRRVGVVTFTGRPDDAELATQEDRLRGWLSRHNEKAAAQPEYAFYNSPMIPGPLRRNEIWLALD